MKPHDLASNDIGEESRLLEAEFPDAVDLDAVVRLKVSLASRPAPGGDAEVGLPPGETVDVVVHPDVDSTSREPIAAAGGPEPRPQQAAELRPEGRGGRPPARPRLPDRRAAGRDHPRDRRRGANGASDAQHHPADAPAARSRQAQPAAPDLTLFVEEWEAAASVPDARQLSGPRARAEPPHVRAVRAELDPAAFFEEFFEEIDRLPRKTKAERDVADRRVAARAPTCRNS